MERDNYYRPKTEDGQALRRLAKQFERASNGSGNAAFEAIKEVELSLLNESSLNRNLDFAEVRALGLRAEDFSNETHKLIFRAM